MYCHQGDAGPKKITFNPIEIKLLKNVRNDTSKSLFSIDLVANFDKRLINHKPIIKNSGKRYVARGGTSPKTVAKVADYGFYGMAFNSYIWDNASPYENFLKILDAYKESNLEV